MSQDTTRCRPGRAWRWSCGVLVFLTAAIQASGQDTTRLMTAAFHDPARASQSRFSETLGGCVSIFRRAIAEYAYDHPPDLTPSKDTLGPEVRKWVPYPSEAIAMARDCYQAVYPKGNDLAEADIATAAPLAIALNEDSLVQVLVSRWIAVVGPDSGKQAALLERVIQYLCVNAGPGGSYGTHLTDAHLAMARAYLARLEALGPGQVLHWLAARSAIENSGGWRMETDAQVQVALDDAKHGLAVMQAVPPSTLSEPDAKRLQQEALSARVYGVQLRTYLKRLDHADLTRFVQLVDSSLGMKRQWLVGRPAPPLKADYWFGVPAGTTPVAPEANAVSLIVFIGPQPGGAATNSAALDATLRHLHKTYPQLRIILMGATDGVWANESLLDHPEREAQLMYQYVHDSLQVPGIMGVLKGAQKVVTADGKVRPVQLPLCDQYMLDVSDLGGQIFLVDREGWVVDQGAWTTVLVPRLLAKQAPGSKAATP